MNHLPFEDWLLDDLPLTPEQERELQTHLRLCNSCTTIARSNLALHSRLLAAPLPGFTQRFQVRMALHRRGQKIRQTIGTLVLIIGGLVLFVWLAGPLFVEAVRSPALWITTAVGYILFILTSIQVVGEIGSILLRVLSSVVTPPVWLTLFLVGLGTVYAAFLSIRRITGSTQGV